MCVSKAVPNNIKYHHSATLSKVFQEVAVNQNYWDGFKMDQAVGGRSKTGLSPTAVLDWEALTND